MINCSECPSLDVLIYDDGLNLTFDRYVNTITNNIYLFKELIKDETYSRVNLVMYSLPISTMNDSLISYLNTIDLHLYVNLVIPKGGIHKGITQLLSECDGDDILLLRLGDTLDSLSKPCTVTELYSSRTEVKDSDKYVDLLNCSGIFCDRAQLYMLMNKINYTEYVTSDMVMLAILTFSDYLYKYLMQYRLMDKPSNIKVHHVPSLTDFYDTLVNRVYRFLAHKDQSHLLRMVINNELAKP